MEMIFGGEGKEAINRKWNEIFSDIISDLIGHKIVAENILDDSEGWYYYISNNSLQERHPLIMCHYCGMLFIVIPSKEYEELQCGVISPEEYINKVHWSFGWYWGGGSMVGGSFWQPLEESSGIHDTEKIRRYLSILKCRTNRRSSGYMPREEDCSQCKVEYCPFSNYGFKKDGASWDNEVQEHDCRRDIFKAVTERAKKELQIELHGLMSHNGETALLLPNSYEKSATLYLPVKLLNELLYHPVERDWEKIASEIKFELGVFNKEERILIVPDEKYSPSEICRNFWSKFGILDEWDLVDAMEKVEKARAELNEARKAKASADNAYLDALNELEKSENHLKILKGEDSPKQEEDTRKRNIFQKLFRLKKSS